jgi:hypothetical protein
MPHTQNSLAETAALLLHCPVTLLRQGHSQTTHARSSWVDEALFVNLEPKGEQSLIRTSAP